jgi:hypothetical protein
VWLPYTFKSVAEFCDIVDLLSVLITFYSVYVRFPQIWYTHLLSDIFPRYVSSDVDDFAELWAEVLDDPITMQCARDRTLGCTALGDVLKHAGKDKVVDVASTMKLWKEMPDWFQRWVSCLSLWISFEDVDAAAKHRIAVSLHDIVMSGGILQVLQRGYIDYFSGGCSLPKDKMPLFQSATSVIRDVLCKAINMNAKQGAMYARFISFTTSDGWSFNADQFRLSSPCGAGYFFVWRQELGTYKLRLVQKLLTKKMRFKFLNRLFPYGCQADKRHTIVPMHSLAHEYVRHLMTKQHRAGSCTNNCLDGTVKACKMSFTALQNLVNSVPIGCPNVLMSTLIVMAMDPSGADAIKWMISKKVFDGPADAVFSKLKSLSIVVRRSGRVADTPARKQREYNWFCGLDLAKGRGAMRSDWDAERRNRCVKPRHLVMPHVISPNDVLEEWGDTDAAVALHGTIYDKLRSEVTVMLRPVVAAIKRDESFRDFMERRHEWLASGSGGGRQIRLGEHRVRANKRVVFETIPLIEIEKWLDSPPEEAAVASEKFENGKPRCIYGVSCEHYVVNTFSTSGIEEKMHLMEGVEKGLSDSAVRHMENKRRFITADPSIECTMLDYADFNRHHTCEAQAIIFEVLADLGKNMGAHPDWVKANLWVANSKYNMWVTFPGRQNRERVVQGMFSGTRSTDFINTLLNVAYFNIAAKWVKEHYGVTADDLYRCHQGDDLFGSNRNRLWARLLFEAFVSMGGEFQDKKQMFGSGRGEYLRLLYEDGIVGGYIVRSLVNFILHPLQSSVYLSPPQMLGGIKDHISTLTRRGLAPIAARALYDCTVSWWSKVRVDHSDHKPLHIPAVFHKAPRMKGGFACSLPGTYYDAVAHPQLPELPSLSQFSSRKDYGLAGHMSKDWIRSVSRRLAQNIQSKTMYEQALVSNLETQQMPQELRKRLRKWKSVVGDFLVLHKSRLASVSGWQSTNEKSVLSLVMTGSADFGRGMPYRDFGFFSKMKYWFRNTQPDSDAQGLSDFLGRLSAKLPLKSIASTQSALGLGPRDAMLWILRMYGSMVDDDRHQLSQLRCIARGCSDDALPYLISPPTDVASYLLEITHPTIVWNLSTTYGDCMLNLCTSHGKATQFNHYQDVLQAITTDRAECVVAHPARAAIMY